MEIKAADVKALREQTGAGMMECKKALQECNGDAKEAAKYLKEKGLAAVEKRSGRVTSEGIIVVKANDSNAVMVELSCETDFVAKNAEFIEAGEKVAQTALDKGYTDIQEDLNAIILDLATRVRENMSLKRLTAVNAASDECISHYVHSDKKIGVVVVLKSAKPEAVSNGVLKEFAYDCCLHIAAFTPAYIKKEDVEQSYIDEQLEVFNGQVAALDKPEKVKEGIVKGKLNKHFSEICFLEQPFVKDDKVSVQAKMKEISKQIDSEISLSAVLVYQLGQ
ncbi:MAG: translation elongation factor Ts [Treponema sp.]